MGRNKEPFIEMGKLWVENICGGGNQEFGLGQTSERLGCHARGAFGNPFQYVSGEWVAGKSVLVISLFKVKVMQKI